MEKNIKKISDVLLEKVSGGDWGPAQVGFFVSVVASGVATSMSVGASIASAVCQSKAKKNREQGNAGTAQKLEKAGRVLAWSSVGAGGLAAVGLGAVAYSLYESNSDDSANG